MDLVDEMLPFYDFSRDPGAGGPLNFVLRSSKNYDNRALHAHVYDLELILKICRFWGFAPLFMELLGDVDQIVFAKKVFSAAS